MAHRRIYATPEAFVIRESGSGRTIAIVPRDPLFECLEPAEKHAKQIKGLPRLLQFLHQRAERGDREAGRLGFGVTPRP